MIDWPSRARVFGTWAYALERALEEAAMREMKLYVYRGVLDGETVWVSSFDPKRRNGEV